MAAQATPQDAARQAAIAGEFGKVYDGRKLREVVNVVAVTMATDPKKGLRNSLIPDYACLEIFD